MADLSIRHEYDDDPGKSSFVRVGDGYFGLPAPTRGTSGHKWAQVEFSYGAWLECACGVRAHNEDDRLNHERAVASGIPESDEGGVAITEEMAHRADEARERLAQLVEAPEQGEAT